MILNVKEVISINDEPFLTLNQISSCFNMESEILELLFKYDYIPKFKVKENKDYYIVPTNILGDINICSNSEKDIESIILFSLNGFIKMGLEIIESQKSDIKKEVAKKMFSANIEQLFATKHSVDKSSNFKFALEEINNTNEEKMEEQKIVNLKCKTSQAWRIASNKAIASLVRHSKRSYDEVRKDIYFNISKKYNIDFHRRLENIKSQAENNGMSRSQINKLNYLDVIANSNKLINIYLSEIVLFARQYNVKINLSKVS